MSRTKEITATRFKAHCLRLLDEVADTGETLVVTKRGRPVVRVEPFNTAAGPAWQRQAAGQR